MSPAVRKSAIAIPTIACLLLISDTAAAFRCGNRIVREGMHEGQVKAACGEPASIRHLGFALRSIYPRRYGLGGIEHTYLRHGYLNEVVVTEYLYNFGPRKLMRVLRFEGGYLVEIETAGYGYREKDRD